MPGGQLVVVAIDGLPALDVEQTYQAWRLGDDGIASLGVIGPSGSGAFAFRGELDAGDAAALSVEPAGGSPQPTSEPVAVAEF